jgi:transglutaminase-like putative cysteine protease
MMWKRIALLLTIPIIVLTVALAMFVMKSKDKPAQASVVEKVVEKVATDAPNGENVAKPEEAKSGGALTKDELLAEIGKNIKLLNTSFTVQALISDDEISELSVSETFPNVQKSSISWRRMEGEKEATLTFELEYFEEDEYEDEYEEIDPGETIYTREELLAEIGRNIERLITTFTLVAEISDDEVSELNVVDYFSNVKESKINWRRVEGDKKATLTFTLVYTMYGKIADAVEAGSAAGLSEQEAEAYEMLLAVAKALDKPGMSEYEKEKAAHDYLVRTVQYKQGTDINDLAHTPYGALVQGYAVCDGYSTAFNLLMKVMGIECELVYGMSNSDTSPPGAHAWNRIKIDGKYYHIDVTWDDPVPDLGDSVQYNYFNLTDKAISKDHQMLVPSAKKCVSEEMNYFNVIGTLAHSVEEAKKMISDALSAGNGTMIKADGFNVRDIDIQSVLQAMNKSISIQYSVNEPQNILNIWIKQ